MSIGTIALPSLGPVRQPASARIEATASRHAISDLSRRSLGSYSRSMSLSVSAAVVLAVSAFALIVAMRLVGRVHEFLYVWPVGGVLMSMLAQVSWRSRGERCVLYLAALAGVCAGSAAIDIPIWLALQVFVLTLLELSLGELLLLPAVASFAELKQRRGMVRFALASVFIPLCRVLIGAPALSHSLHHSIARTAVQAFFADSLGIGLFYPLGLMILTQELSAVRRELFRRGALLSLGFFTLVAVLTFLQSSSPFLFIVFPPMIVALLVLGLDGAVVISLLLSVVGWYATMHGHGPIWLMRHADAEHRLLVLQAFLWTSLATAMPVGALLDERKQAEHKAEESKAIFQVMLQNADEMIVLSSMDGSQRYVSPAVERLTGCKPEEFLAIDRVETFHPDDRDLVALALENLRAGKWQQTLRYRLMHKEGGHRWVEANIRAYGDEVAGTISGYVGAIRDISALRQTEHQWAQERAELAREQQRLAGLASTDALTGLPNRRAFEDQMRKHETAMQQPTDGTDSSLAVLMVDVDFFKLYNDTYGHAEGDDCLRQLACVLQRNLNRPHDLVARLGGEEFAIVLPGTTAATATAIANRLLHAVSCAERPHTASPLGRVTVSIGVAAATACSGFSHALLLQQADRALYQSKGTGRNRAMV